MNWLMYPYWKYRHHLVRKNFLECLEEEATEEFLKVLLQFLRFACFIDGYLRKSIKDFQGRIELRSEDKGIRVLAEFDNGSLKPSELDPEEELPTPANASIVFKNPEAIKNFLLPKGGLQGRRDVLRSILNNEVRLEGNFNYIYRLGFLATHLQLHLQRPLG
jgi:hypothetical protein